MNESPSPHNSSSSIRGKRSEKPDDDSNEASPQRRAKEQRVTSDVIRKGKTMDSDKLVQGKVYFNCGYETAGKPIPRIEALIYLGKNLATGEGQEGDEYWFQNPQIYFIGDVTVQRVKEEILRSVEGEDKIIIPHDSIHLMKSYDEMLEWLSSLRKSVGAAELY